MKDKEIREKISPVYFDKRMKGAEQKYNEAAIKAILPYLKGENILKLGCGEGIWTEVLIKIYRKVVVVDASEFLLKHLKEKLGNAVECYNSLIEEFETDKKFDTILAAHILEHVEDPVKVLAKAKTWLSKNGQIIIVVPNALSLHRRIGRVIGLLKREEDLSESDKLLGHKRVYSKKSLFRDIELSGLRIEAWEGLG